MKPHSACWRFSVTSFTRKLSAIYINSLAIKKSKLPLPKSYNWSRKAMKLIGVAICGVLAASALGQDTFSVSGTLIPPDLAQVNYGTLPKSVVGFDLNICNQTTNKQPVTSSQIYQALTESSPGMQPIGRQIILAVILRNQKRSATTVLTVVLNSAVGVLSVLGASRTGVPANVLAGAAVGSVIGQQLLSGLKPVLTADQVERYESQVLEPALVLDGGSCVERTMFTLTAAGPASTLKNLRFHVR
jgi:hypothetical protein